MVGKWNDRRIINKTKKIKIMNLAEFKKTVEIYKSHNLKNNFISITYANVLCNNSVGTESTIEIEKNGGALISLYFHLCK